MKRRVRLKIHVFTPRGKRHIEDENIESEKEKWLDVRETPRRSNISFPT